MIRLMFTSLLILICASISKAGEPFFVFAPDQDRKEVVRLLVDPGNETISETGRIEVPFEPKGMAFNRAQNQLIVTSANRDNGAVATISVAEKMSVIESSKLAHPSGYVSIDRKGRFLMTANYRHGIVSTYPIKENGGVGDLACSVKTPNREAHCVLTTPNNRFTYTPCVKNSNALFQFSFDEETGKLNPLEPFNANPPAKFGPRHVAYHKSLPIAYFSNEQQIGVSVYQVGDDGQLDDIQHATTLPRRGPYVKGKRDLNASDLAISNDRNLLFVATRDFASEEDSVFTFRIEEDGRLALIARSKVGDTPWKLDVSPCGDYLLVSCTGAQNLTLYCIGEDGKLSKSTVHDWHISVRDMVIVK